MANVAQLADRIVEATGFDGADVRVRARNLRENDILPTSSRRRGEGDVEVWHAVALFLGCMAGGPQTQVVQAVRTLFLLPRSREDRTDTLFSDDTGLLVQRRVWWTAPEGHDGIWPPPLGYTLCELVELACNPQTRETVLRSIERIRVFRNLRLAQIDRCGMGNIGPTLETYAAAPEEWLAAEERIRRAPVFNLTVVSGQILLELADVVLHTRAERRRANLPPVSFDDVRRALGLPAPENPSGGPGGTGSPESEAPVPVAREPAQHPDQPRDDEASSSNGTKANAERETSQGSSRAGRFAVIPHSPRERTGDEPEAPSHPTRASAA